MQDLSSSRRSPLPRRVASSGAMLTLAAAVLWLSLAAWRDGTTFHLAPAVVVAAWAVADRVQSQTRLTHAQAAGRFAAGAVAAMAVTLVLELSGRLDGPFLAGGSALGETLLVTGGAVLLGWLAVTAHRRRR